MAIRPVIINVIPSPRNGAGTLEYAIFSRIAAMAKMANNHPIPEPSPYKADSPIETKLFCCINSDQTKMAQFTAISGKKIHKAP